jgi:hypothetical protein
MVSRLISPLIHLSTEASSKIDIETQSIGNTVRRFLCTVKKILRVRCHISNWRNVGRIYESPVHFKMIEICTSWA